MMPLILALWGGEDSFLAVGSSASPLIKVYSHAGDKFISLSTPSPAPTFWASSISFSPDASLMALAGGAADLKVYNTDGFNTVSVPSIPTNNNSCKFSSDGKFFAATAFASPYIAIWSLAGGALSRLADPASLPPGVCDDCAFSPNGTYLAVVSETSPYVKIYKISGTTFSALSSPMDSIPSTSCHCVSWSPDSSLLAVGYGNATSPYLDIYSRSGDIFTKMSAPVDLPGSSVNYIAFSPDGNYLALTLNSSPYLLVYSVSGSTLTRTSDPATLPPGIARGVSWSQDSSQLAVAHDNSPYVSIYDMSAGALTKIANPSSLPAGAGWGIAFGG